MVGIHGPPEVRPAGFQPDPVEPTFKVSTRIIGSRRDLEDGLRRYTTLVS